MADMMGDRAPANSAAPDEIAKTIEARYLDDLTQLESILTRLECAHQTVETMPTVACQFFYDCRGRRSG